MKRTTLTLAVALALALPATGCWWAYCDDDDPPPVPCNNDEPNILMDDLGLLYFCDCYGDNCTPYTCTQDADCDQWSYCDDAYGQCHDTNECVDSWECWDGLTCDPARGVCTDDFVCTESWECPLDTVCDPSVGRCVPDEQPVPCDERADCGYGEICGPTGTCVPGPGTCTDNAQCGPGAYCAEGTCVSSALCGGGVECLDPATPICENGTCVPEEAPQYECQDNTGCDPGFRCVNGFCAETPAPGPGETCQFDEQCNAGQCIDGKCHALCGTIDECGSGQDCVNGLCWDVETPGTECLIAEDCAANQACVNGTCFASGCTQDTDCPSANDHCDAAGICVGDTTAEPECTLSTDCNGVEQCVEGVCRTPCTDVADCVPCGLPVCHLSYCFEAVPACVIAAECNPGESCVDAQCVVQ
jgi:hypothetical protein